jgi:rare lipoprotein A (peptidoglycan hydrolase)
MKLLLPLLLLIASQPHQIEAQARPTPKPWSQCVYTQYAARFEGRKCADGSVFRHRQLTVACRHLPLGSRITLRYWSGKRWVEVPVTVTDRGRLPLHRRDRPQFDVSREVARRLGLYAKRKDYRGGEWQK